MKKTELCQFSFTGDIWEDLFLTFRYNNQLNSWNQFDLSFYFFVSTFRVKDAKHVK